MRIIVLSDSHKALSNLRTAIEEQRDKSATLIFLGDGLRDLESCEDLTENMRIIAVKGNCDMYCPEDSTALSEIGGKRIYCTHGYLEKVKYGNMLLYEQAEKYDADIILYGHTHRGVTEYHDGRYFFNPGSIMQGDYGFIDITPSGIMCIHRNIRD